MWGWQSWSGVSGRSWGCVIRSARGELKQAALYLWEVVDPEGAEDVEAQRLAREERRAKAARVFRLTPDRHGSMRISGQIPSADGALFRA